MADDGEHGLWQFRPARRGDVSRLRTLIEASVRGLQAGDYTASQIEGALGTVLGLDTLLIEDQTYFVAETVEKTGEMRIAGCGGWSRRKTLCGSDQAPGRDAGFLDPGQDAAKIRAIFVHPDFARRGLGSAILAHVEAQAVAAGFRSFEMGSTLTGVPLYRLKGYVAMETFGIALPNGDSLPVVRMTKNPNSEAE